MTSSRAPYWIPILWVQSSVALRSFRERNRQDGAWVRHELPLATANQSNRRRLYVFLGTLAVTLVTSLCYTWLRPAEYRASARLEITPATGAAPAGPTVRVKSGVSFSTFR